MSKIKVGEHIKIIPGFPFNSALFNNDGEGLPLIRIRDLLTSKIETYYRGEFPYEYLIEEGDILIGMDGDFHIVKWKNKTKALLNQRIMKVAQKNGAKINIDYFYYFLFPFLSEVWEKTTATTVKHLSTYDVSEAEIEFPKFEVQQQIAKILYTSDAVIEKTQTAIAKYKAIKQGMLEDLFTRGIDLSTNKLRPRYQDAPELYKESKLGMIPREWDCEKLEKLSSLITKGESPNWQGFNYQETGILFVTSENVRDGEMDIVKNKKFIPFEFHEKLERSQLKKDDVLINLVGASIARSAHYNFDFPANINQAVALIRLVSSELNVLWFASYLQFHRCIKRLLGEQVETARANLSLNNLRMFLVAKPPVEEQERIAERLKGIDNKLHTEQTCLQKMQNLKKGLMEDLLSGKKQVKVAEELVTQNEN